MPTIYKITNLINDKIYIGSTKRSLEKRFNEHCCDSINPKRNHRPLYRDILEYGSENFTIEPIEFISEEMAEEREIYWIKHYNSRDEGYNITLGGGGKRLIDDKLEKVVIKTYSEQKNLKATAQKAGVSIDSVINVCERHGVPVHTKEEAARLVCEKKVDMYENGVLLHHFVSLREAAKFLSKNRESGTGKIDPSHISQCARGLRKSAYGYTWKFPEE